MAAASLNIKLDYNQVLELARHLSEEDKNRLKNELIAEANKAKLSYFQNLFSSEDSEKLSLEEIQTEVNELRRERCVSNYKNLEREDCMVVVEPTVAYRVNSLQGLKSRLKASIEETTDGELLEQCLGLLQRKPRPCVYTDEEFVQVLAEAEASGYVAHEDALKEFEKWGFVR